MTAFPGSPGLNPRLYQPTSFMFWGSSILPVSSIPTGATGANTLIFGMLKFLGWGIGVGVGVAVGATVGIMFALLANFSSSAESCWAKMSKPARIRSNSILKRDIGKLNANYTIKIII